MHTYTDTGSAHVDMAQFTLVQQVSSEEHQVSARYPVDTQYCWSALEEQLLVRHMKRPKILKDSQKHPGRTRTEWMDASRM